MDTVDIFSVVIILFSLGIFYWFGRFTVKLIRQHYDIYPLLYEYEESEKKKDK
jgi:hypothetical protein